MKSVELIREIPLEDVSHADLVKAVLEIAAEVDEIKEQIASGRAGARINRHRSGTARDDRWPNLIAKL